MTDMILAKIHELEENQEFIAKMDSAQNIQDALSIMKEYGIDTTEEELQKILFNDAMSAENDELSEDMLDTISGGSVWDWFKALYDKLCRRNKKDLDDIIAGLSK